jgi:hypothetical protein
MMAYDVCGVQPMTGPTGLIFAMKSTYKTTRAGATSGNEALYNEAVTGFSGDSAVTNIADGSGLAGVTDTNADSTIDDQRNSAAPAGGMTKADGEQLGTSGAAAWAEMGFTIDRADVSAKTRALKAEYSLNSHKT